jgi:plastocyanin/polyisoprenoid-binding protein YceI
MTSTQKIAVGVALAALAAGGGFYLYVSKPVAAPSAQNAVNPPAQGDGAEMHTFYIDPQKSEVSFTLDEVLRGEPTVVVGTTDRVDGTFTFDPAQPNAAVFNTIRVNARTLATDSPQRNGAIARLILESEKPSNEFITFTPSSVDGIPSTARVGDAFEVSVLGNLKIRDIGRDVTFSGTVTLVSADKIEMDLSTTVTRADYELTIPNIPFVANVSQDVKLRAKLTATKQEQPAMMPSQIDGHAEGEGETEDEVMDKEGASDPVVEADASVVINIGGVQEITVSGSNFTFAPSAFTVKKGQKVRLTFKNTGGNHDFVIDELGVSTKLLKDGEEQVVEFTPDKTGSFEFYCSVGKHREMGMKGMITVE